MKLNFNAITKEPLHLLHDPNDKKSSISFYAIFFIFEINNIIRAGAIRSIAWVAFFPSLKLLRSFYGSEWRKISVVPKKINRAGANWGKSPSETFCSFCKITDTPSHSWHSRKESSLCPLSLQYKVWWGPHSTFKHINLMSSKLPWFKCHISSVGTSSFALARG